MAKSILDAAEVNVPCPACGKVMKKAVGWLKTHKQLKCAGCGEDITLETAQFKREMDKADKALASFRKVFKR